MLISGVICDGPRCKKGPGERRMEVFWDAAAVNKGKAAPPDEYFKFVNRQRTWDETCTNISDQPALLNFCSNDCERDFMRDEKPVIGPREQAAIAENNKKVEEKRLAKLDRREDLKPVVIDQADGFAKSEVEEHGKMEVVPIPISKETSLQQVNPESELVGHG